MATFQDLAAIRSRGLRRWSGALYSGCLSTISTLFNHRYSHPWHISIVTATTGPDWGTFCCTTDSCWTQLRLGGNKYKLVQHHCYLRKYYFTNWVIHTWNSLSNRVVSADIFNTFKNCLDNYWSNQDVLYDYKAYLHGIGNDSIVIYLFCISYSIS